MEQTIESRKRTAVQWKKGFTVDEYLKRDAIMDEYEHARDGKLVTWVLAPRDDPQTLDFMCSCESFKRPGIVARRTPKGPIVEEIPCYGVASVFTPAEKRGKGYAKHMMRLLHWVLAPRDNLPEFPSEWGAPPSLPPNVGDALFSVLSSDIGPFFYAESGPAVKGSGWIIRDPYQTIWSSIRASPPLNASNSVAGEWRLLDEDAAKILWDKDGELMKKEAARFMSSTATRPAAFALLPTQGVAAFNFHRQMSFTPDGKIQLPAETWGIQLITPDANPHEPNVFATWTIERQDQPQNFVVTRLRATPETFPTLLGKIFEVAKKEGVDQVDIWNLPKDLEAVARGLGGVTSDRSLHLPSFKWYGPESEEQVDWLFNEKYLWC
ncbi:hypothetical protein K474DRAFT_1711926 [Panus rudis PR-1116 ss-1]|nr:hypothetical protein K474DRAFT_1711926 [Panus rudis PR-1116 ss-1]